MEESWRRESRGAWERGKEGVSMKISSLCLSISQGARHWTGNGCAKGGRGSLGKVVEVAGPRGDMRSQQQGRVQVHSRVSLDSRLD